MGFFDFLQNENKEQEEVRAFGASFVSALYGSFECNEEEVVKIPVVQSILEICGGTIAPLPIYLFKDNGDGSIERQEDDYRENILNQSPNSLLSAYNLKKNMVKDYLLYGASRTYVDKNRNKVIGLYPIPSNQAQIEIFADNAVTVRGYKLRVDNEFGSSVFTDDELLAVLRDSKDGVTSKGALHYGSKIFSVVSKEVTYMEGIYENGAMPLGVLKAQNRLTEPVLNRLKASWQSLYTGSKNAGKTVILEEGLEYQPISINPKDLMMVDTRKENISEICRLFNIPESLVNANANKYGSLEQNNIAFLQYTLSPIISAIENALNASLLLEEEKEKGYFFAFDTSEILRTTEKDKYEAIKVGLDSGVITMNEARYKLNLKGIKDDIMKWSLGSVLYYPETGEMKIPNMGIGIEGASGSRNPQNNLDASTEEKETPKEDELYHKQSREEINKKVKNGTYKKGSEE